MRNWAAKRSASCSDGWLLLGARRLLANEIGIQMCVSLSSVAVFDVFQFMAQGKPEPVKAIVAKRERNDWRGVIEPKAHAINTRLRQRL